MKNSEQKIVHIKQSKERLIIAYLYAGAWNFAYNQGKPEPEKPKDIAEAIELLAKYLPG
jgi:hypothetical protein